LQNALEWIDLFAGTGAVGIEALSRGARQVHFVESERRHARLIRENLQSLKISGGYDVYESDSASALRSLDASGETCDFCFLDPPYQMRGGYERALEFLGQSRLVGPASIVIAEHEKKYEPGEKFGALTRYRRILQGDAALSLYRVQAQSE
jgi:16S rRNA (guanine(966)-N(2))-methyltransferase RsmD